MENLRPGSRELQNAYSGLSFLLFAVMSLVSACSHSRDYDRREAAFAGVYAAQPPAFLKGAMSILLTNGGGYIAHVTVEGDSFANRDGLKSGQLLCRGSKLLFAPAQNQSDKKQVRAGGFAFIWDTASNSGYVLSGSLEGYAPVSFSVRATNVVVQANGVNEKTAGHPSILEHTVVQFSDGTSATFEVWRATDLNGFPLRIGSAASGIPLTLTFSDIRLAPPPEDVFAPPDDFTKYASPEAMTDEMAARQHNLRRKSTGELEPMQPVSRQPH